MRVRIERLTGPDRQLIAEGAIGADGTFQAPPLAARFDAGVYEASFDVGRYLASVDPDSPDSFLGWAPFRFHLADPEAHYHLPFKFTAWGFSCFRGGA